jgi:hypothetical protein
MTIVVGIPGVQGPPGISWQGQWSSTASYAASEGVSYEGSSYIALTPSLNVAPGTSPSQWGLLASVGSGATTMTGSNGTEAGTAGSVPAPGVDAQGRFLRGDGTWAPGAVSGLTYAGSQLTGYTEDGIAYTLAYSGNGTLNTITGGGSVGTVQYTSGAVSGISYT